MEVPRLTVGPVKGRSRAAAVYVPRRKTIYASNRESLFEPAVILHEFYHHLRTRSGKHRGTEKHADLFAKDYLDAYSKAWALLSVQDHGGKSLNDRSEARD